MKSDKKAPKLIIEIPAGMNYTHPTLKVYHAYHGDKNADLPLLIEAENGDQAIVPTTKSQMICLFPDYFGSMLCPKMYKNKPQFSEHQHKAGEILKVKIVKLRNPETVADFIRGVNIGQLQLDLTNCCDFFTIANYWGAFYLVDEITTFIDRSASIKLLSELVFTYKFQQFEVALHNFLVDNILDLDEESIDLMTDNIKLSSYNDLDHGFAAALNLIQFSSENLSFGQFYRISMNLISKLVAVHENQNISHEELLNEAPVPIDHISEMKSDIHTVLEMITNSFKRFKITENLKYYNSLIEIIGQQNLDIFGEVECNSYESFRILNLILPEVFSHQFRDLSGKLMEVDSSCLGLMKTYFNSISLRSSSISDESRFVIKFKESDFNQRIKFYSNSYQEVKSKEKNTYQYGSNSYCNLSFRMPARNFRLRFLDSEKSCWVGWDSKNQRDRNDPPGNASRINSIGFSLNSNSCHSNFADDSSTSSNDEDSQTSSSSENIERGEIVLNQFRATTSNYSDRPNQYPSRRIYGSYRQHLMEPRATLPIMQNTMQNNIRPSANTETINSGGKAKSSPGPHITRMEYTNFECGDILELKILENNKFQFFHEGRLKCEVDASYCSNRQWYPVICCQEDNNRLSLEVIDLAN